MFISNIASDRDGVAPLGYARTALTITIEVAFDEAANAGLPMEIGRRFELTIPGASVPLVVRGLRTIDGRTQIEAAIVRPTLAEKAQRWRDRDED